MRSRAPRGRMGRASPVASAAFLVACLVVLALTFLLGMLVGRQWARSTMPIARAVVGGDRPADRASVERRGADRPRRLGEHEPDDVTPRIQEKLTFYQTLTAPLAAGPPRAPKPKSTPPPAGTSGRDAGAGTDAGTGYTVQVAAFKTREQADALREKLGSDAYVAQVEGASSAKYRVRFGTFAARADGEVAAARLRAERHPTAFVTKR